MSGDVLIGIEIEKAFEGIARFGNIELKFIHLDSLICNK
jgi:hypothetical protein